MTDQQQVGPTALLRVESHPPGHRSRGWPLLQRHLPITGWLRSYDRRWLRADLLAGCVVAALAVPQALGYAAIAGVPVELGLSRSCSSPPGWRCCRRRC